jgi:hypothetical protein
VEWAAAPSQAISWSTASVLQQTISAAAAAGLRLAPPGSLPTLRDIDTLEDLRAWAADQRARSAASGALGAKPDVGSGVEVLERCWVDPGAATLPLAIAGHGRPTSTAPGQGDGGTSLEAATLMNPSPHSVGTTVSLVDATRALLSSLGGGGQLDELRSVRNSLAS